MTSESTGKLWLDASGTRFFVIPQGWSAPPGDFELLDLEGQSLGTTEDAVAPFQVDDVTADALIQAAAERPLRVVDEAMEKEVDRLKASAPGVSSLLQGTLRGGGTDPVEAFSHLLGLDAARVREDPSQINAALGRLLNQLGEVAGDAGADDAEPPKDIEGFLRRAEAMLERVVARVQKHHPERDLRTVKSIADLIEFIFKLQPREVDPKVDYAATAKASVDNAFKDFKLPSFKYEDLLRGEPAAAAPKDEAEPDPDPDRKPS